MKKWKQVMAGVLIVCLLGMGMPDNLKTAGARTKTLPAKGAVISLSAGESITIRFKKCNKKMKWKTSNKKVATVKRKKKAGYVVAKSAGSAKITASAGKKKYTCKVVVKEEGGSGGNTGSSNGTGSSGGSGSSGDTGSGGGSGNSGNTGNSGGSGSSGNTGNSGGNGNGGNSGNTGNGGGTGNTGNGGNTGETQDYDASTVNSTNFSEYFSLHAIHKSTATYYDNGYTNTCCNLDDIAPGYDVAAINEYDYNNGLMAGAYLEVTGPKGTVNVLVTDLMPYVGNESNCTVGALDLNENTFAKIADRVDGKVQISWKVIAFPTTGPLQYKFKDTSSQWWCEVQVRNQRYPVAKCEIKNSDGTYTELPRKEYNYFAAANGLGTGPYTFRVTDIYGQVVEDTGIALTPGGIVNGHANFAAKE